MQTYIALLRGVNVGGHRMIAMSDLVALLDRLGLTDARSLLQSGNLVFRASGRTSAQLEKMLDAEVQKRLGVETKFFVRTADELKDIIAKNPFKREAKDDPGHLLVMFLHGEAKDVKTLQDAIKGRETFRAIGRQLYIVYPDGVGTSKFTNALIEKKLGVRGTARNWNTVLKLNDEL